MTRPRDDQGGEIRQLIEWPTYEAIGAGNQNEPRCVDCFQRPSEHSPHCQIAQRNAALEAYARLLPLARAVCVNTIGIKHHNAVMDLRDELDPLLPAPAPTE